MKKQLQGMKRICKYEEIRNEMIKIDGFKKIIELLFSNNNTDYLPELLETLLLFLSTKSNLVLFNHFQGFAKTIEILTNSSSEYQFRILKFYKKFIKYSNLNLKIAQAIGILAEAANFLSSKNPSLSSISCSILIIFAEQNKLPAELILPFLSNLSFSTLPFHNRFAIYHLINLFPNPSGSLSPLFFHCFILLTPLPRADPPL